MSVAIAKARALEAKAIERREENRRKFPTAARLVEQFKSFGANVVEAEENGNYTVHKNFVVGVSVIPHTDARKCEEEAAKIWPGYARPVQPRGKRQP